MAHRAQFGFSFSLIFPGSCTFLNLSPACLESLSVWVAAVLYPHKTLWGSHLPEESPALISMASSLWLSSAQCGSVGQSRDFGARQSVVQITVWTFTSWVTLGKVLLSHKPHFPHLKMDLIFCRDVVRIEFYAYLYIYIYILAIAKV